MVKSDSPVARIDKSSGLLSGYEASGKQIIASAFRPNFWRAATDNDRRGWKTEELLGVWKNPVVEKVSVSASPEDNDAVVTSEISYAGNTA